MEDAINSNMERRPYWNLAVARREHVLIDTALSEPSVSSARGLGDRWRADARSFDVG